MMGRTAAWGAALTFTMSTTGAYAEDAPTGGGASTKAGSAVGTTGEWGGLYNGRTLGSGGGAVFAEGGWPGGGIGVLFGLHNIVDLGAEVGPLFGGFYETGSQGAPFNATFGLDLRVKSRFAIVSGDTVSLLARVEPGVRFASFNVVTSWGVEIVAGLDVGIKVAQGMSVYLGLEIPLTFYTNPASFTQLPIFPGAGFEYHVNDFIGLGGRVMAGPSIAFVGGVTRVDFGMIGQGFFIFRWDRVK